VREVRLKANLINALADKKRRSEQMEKKKVLIADDELYIRLLVKRALDIDYIVLEASNGEQAIDITHREKPDLILMDILMPKLDGYTACHAIKTDQLTKAIPVIMVTGIGHELNRKLSQQMGACGYLTKPFNPQELLAKVKQHELATCATAA